MRSGFGESWEANNQRLEAWTVVDRGSSGIHLVNFPAVAYAFQAGELSGWVCAIFRQGDLRVQLRAIDRPPPPQGQAADRV